MSFGKLKTLFKRAHFYLAVDIGSQNTKIMICNLDKDLIIEAMIIKTTPEGAFQNGVIQDESVLSAFLNQCVAGMELLDREFKVIASISGKGLIGKKIDIAPMDESLIPEFVEIEAEQELFYDKEEMSLDYDILEEVNFKQPEAKSLFVITVLKKTIESYNSLFKKTFMRCDVLDTSFTALFNAFEHGENLDKNKNYMFLDVGCFTTVMLIIIKNQVVFARNISIGGNFFTQEIQKKMGIDYQEAEDLKISAGKTNQPAPQEVITLIKNLNEAFYEEIFSCYNLYLSLFSEKNVNVAYCAGGASQTFGLCSHLQDKFGFQIKNFNPFQGIKVNPNLMTDKKELEGAFSQAVGLVLRARHDKS